MIGEEQHVLRYWEREFIQLKPQKNRAGNRVYTAKDLAVLRLIKKLLREERYTVAGAKEHLKQQGVENFENALLNSQEAVESTPHVDNNERLRNAAKAVANELRQIASDLRTSTYHNETQKNS